MAEGVEEGNITVASMTSSPAFLIRHVSAALQSLSLRRPWKALQSSPSAAQLKSIVADRRSKPWRSVEDLRPDLHQPVIDGLQRVSIHFAVSRTNRRLN